MKKLKRNETGRGLRRPTLARSLAALLRGGFTKNLSSNDGRAVFVRDAQSRV